MNHSFVTLLLRWLFTAVGVVLASKLVTGISYDTPTTLFIVVLLLSFLNTALRPVLIAMSLPLIVLTAGFGLILINAVLFLLVGALVKGFQVDGFFSALLGSVVVGLTSLFLSIFIKPEGRTPGPSGNRTKKPPFVKGGDDDVIDI